MTSNQLQKLAAQMEEDAKILRAAERIVNQREHRAAAETLPTKLRQAAKLRTPKPAAPPTRGAGTAQLLNLVQQFAVAGKPITIRALLNAGSTLTKNGIGSALHRHGFKSHKGIWTHAKKHAKKHANKPKGYVAAAKVQTLARIVREAGQPMRYGELVASAAKEGIKATPQTFGAALRHHWLERAGDTYTVGTNGAA